MGETFVLVNGRVHLTPAPEPVVEAVGIRQGRIAAVGSSREVDDLMPDPDRRIDLKGKAVFPSFSDSYGSFFREVMAESQVNLSDQQSIPEVFAVVERYAKALPRENWIIGYGWNKSQWGWKRFPHRADLDLVSPHHPVALFSSDQRVAWLNSAALEKVGIHHGTPDPPGGEVERDSATRAATGIFKEKAVDMVLENIPIPGIERLEKAAGKVADSYFRIGVTHVQSHDRKQAFALYQALSEKDQLPLRLLIHFPFSMGRDLLELGCISGQRLGGLQVGGLWIHVDGTLASQTAWMLEPYTDDWNHFGLEITPEDEIRKSVAWCYENGFMPVLHASGDAACRNSLKVLHELRDRCKDRFPFLVNADLVSAEDHRYVSELNLNIICNPQRVELEAEVGRQYWGPRWNRALDFRAWLDGKAHLLFGSGDPLVRWHPLKALQSAVSPSEEARRPNGRVTVEEGLRALSYRWRSSGPELWYCPSLEKGETADLVVLSEDPYQVAPDKIGRIEFLATLSAGRVVFEIVDNLGS